MPVIPFLSEFIGYGGLLLATFGFFWWRLKDIFEPDNLARERWMNRLARQDWPRRYAGMIDRPLNWLDRHLTPELEEDGSPLKRVHAAAAWSSGALSAMLSLAVAYPILSLILQWVAIGDAATIAGLLIFPAESQWWVRAAAIGALSFQVVVLAKFLQSSRTVYSLFWMILSVAFVIAFGFAVASTATVTGAVAVTFAFAGAGLGAVAASFALAFVATLVFAGAFAFADQLVFAGAAAIAVAVAFAQDWLGHRTERPTLVLSGYAILMVTFLFVIIDLTTEISGVNGGPRGFILFIGVLPLLNGLTDFLSLGATRYFLRAAETARTAFHRARLWLYDAGAALGALLLFALTSIAFITFAVPGDGRPLTDLPALFDDIRASPDDYWWLAFMLLSTLIPSLIHLIILAYSAFCFTPHRLRAWIAENIDAGAKGDRPKGRDGALGLVALCTLSLWLPTVLLIEISWLLWTHSGGLRDLSLSAAEAYHGWLTTFGPE